MGVQKNDIIDYFDERRICSALVLEVEGHRLRILNELGKEAKISAGRVLIGGTLPGFPISGTKDAQVTRLKELSARRQEISRNIDLRELWDVVGPETEEIGVGDLADLLFGKSLDTDSSAALLRSVSEDRTYFRIRPDMIEVIPADRVEQTLLQRDKEKKRIDFIAASADFLESLKAGSAVRPETVPDGFVPLLEQAAMCGPDWVTFKTVKEIFSRAGVSQKLDPFSVLVRLGVWSEDENIRLRAEKIPTEFDPEAEADALDAAGRLLPGTVEDLTAEFTIAVDSAATRDVDDALSLSYEGDDAIVGVHITDVAHYVDHDSPLDLIVRERATSIYLPDRTIPMIPAALSEKAASLEVGEIRPSLSAMVRIGPGLGPKDFRIVPSLIRVDERLSYEDADRRMGDPTRIEARLYAIASALRERRVSSGAIILKDPELAVRVTEDGAIEVSVRDRDTPSQIMISEMMILANTIFAGFLKKHQLPGIFRSQPPPTEKVHPGDTYDPVLSYRCRKAMVRGDVGPDPAPHSTLGVAAYTTATSPLRRYPDLIVQRQIKEFLNKGTPRLNRDQVEKILTEISYPLERAAILERERQRYFLLKYLQQMKADIFEALILQRFPKFHLVQISQFGFNAPLRTPDSLALNPYDRALVRIEKINPREDKLSFSLVKLI